MNSFAKGLQDQSNLTETENLGKAYHSTLNAHLDFFSKVGIPNDEITRYFHESFQADPETALRILVYSRDILEGIGLRKNFMTILPKLVDRYLDAEKSYRLVGRCINAGIGSWKDIFKYAEEKLDAPLLIRLAKKVNSSDPEDADDRLFWKWFPRKGKVFSFTHKYLMITPKELRKLLVASTDVVETKVCSKSFKEIDYSKVPSKAFKRHTKAFRNHDAERFAEFTKKAIRGEVKVKAGAIYPHEVLGNLVESMWSRQTSISEKDWDAIEGQWKNLPRTAVQENLYFPIIDCSGSMIARVLGNFMAIAIAHALGIYFAEMNSGAFKNMLMAFSSDAHFIQLSGTLKDKAKRIVQESDVANTNLKLVFDKLLDLCIKNGVKQDELPKFLLIISDGQWDQMMNNANNTVFEYAEKQFKAIGLEIPRIVFWNVSNYQNQPFTIKNHWVVTVSGPSPNNLKGIMTGKTSAVDIMNELIMKPRYDFVKEVL